MIGVWESEGGATSSTENANAKGEIKIDEIRPWEQPFWKPAPGKWPVLGYIVLVHVVAIIGLILYPVPSLKIATIAIVLAAFGGLGTTVGYHRLLAHRTLKVNPAVEHILIFWAMFNGSGNPASWVGYHRHHHSRTDTLEDISSPKQGGFWWAHLRWLYQSHKADVKKWCPDMNRPVYKFWRLAEGPLAVISLLCGFAYGWEGFFWIGGIRLVYNLHMQCFVNSLMHLGEAEDGDFSKNIWWLGPFQLTAWGENWHGNHHANAGSARIGLKWWQTDIGWYFISAMELVGLADNVKRPK